MSPQKLFCFITYLLEDEQELSLGMLIRLKRIYNFKMPQCQFPVFCCFWFQKSYTGNILGIGRNKSRNSYFSRNLPEHQRSVATRPGGGLTPLGAARVWPRQGQVWAPSWPPDAVLSPIYCLRTKSYGTEIRNPRKVPPPPSSSTLDREGSGALPGTLPEGEIIAGGLFITMPASGMTRE